MNELERKERGAVLRYDHNSRRYSFADPIFRTFALAVFNNDKKKRKKNGVVITIPDISDDLLDKLVNFLMKEIKK